MRKLRLIPVFGAPIEITKDVLIGRDASCDVVVADGSVSRRHVRIEWRGQNWAVVDQASANGTFVDSQRVTEAGLRHGQELRLGGLPFKLEVEGEEEDIGATISTAGLAGATVLQQSPIGRPPATTPPPSEPPPPAATSPLPRPTVPPAAPPRTPAAPPRPPLPPHIPITASIPPRPRIAEPAPPPAPPKKGRGPLFWVATGCCGCLGLVVLLAAVVGGSVYVMTRGPVDAVRGQLAEIKRGDLDRAYARLSSEAQLRQSREDFERLVSQNPLLREHTDALFWFPEGSVHVVNDRADVKGVLVSRGGAREEAAFELVKEDGEWKILTIRVGRGGGSAESDPAADQGPLQIVTTRVDKTPASDGGEAQVTIQIRVRGFEARPDGDAHRVDLVEDLETRGPDGARIETLSQDDFYRYSTPQTTAPDFADFETKLLFSEPAAGAYRCRLTIRDLLSGSRRVHEVPFELP